jgi:MFS family permease
MIRVGSSADGSGVPATATRDRLRSDRLPFPAMDRSLWAVLAGTFTLRFSTGLTGAMLGAYLATIAGVSPIVVGIFGATFYLAELVLSPVFGVLSDRQGHHKVMLYGPAFGAIAVIITAFTTNLVLLGGTRWLEGASTAASVPSILGFIAMVTAGNAELRGKASARFEGSTLLGLGAGFAVAPILFAVFGPTAFLLNAVVYGLSFLIFWTVKDPAGEAASLKAPHVGFSRYLHLLRTSHVWLLAPTWIAVNASIGLWFSQSIFQFAKANPDFPDQSLMRGFEPWQISLAALVIGLLFGAGLIYWGNRFKDLRRTTMILYGILGGGALVAAGIVINHAAGSPIVILLAAVGVAGFGLFVLAGATPAALGLLADMSERFPNDRGAIMGLYSVFLAVGQIIGAVIGGFAAEAAGIDGMLVATGVLLAVALIPLAQLRRDEEAFDVSDGDGGHGDGGHGDALVHG